MLKTSDDAALLIMRIVIGVVFFPHGAQKVFGWFDGYGYSGTMAFFTGAGIPAFLAFLEIMAEFLGSLGLVTGLLTRLAAFGIGVNMVVAIFLVHLPNGLFMNWTGKQAGEGFEYHLLVIAIAISLVMKGAGLWSVDKWLHGKLSSGKSSK